MALNAVSQNCDQVSIRGKVRVMLCPAVQAYKIKYEAPGDPMLAGKAIKLLR